MPAATYTHGTTALAIDQSGNTYLSGYFFGSLGIGSTALIETTGGSIFLAKLGPNGAVLWAQKYVGTKYGISASAALAITPSQDIVMTGYIGSDVNFGDPGGPLALMGQYDGFVAAFEPTMGTGKWAFRFGDPNDMTGYVDTGTSIATDKTGNIYLTGYLYGQAQFGMTPMLNTAGSTDVFLARLDPSGAPVWAKLFGDDQTQMPGGVGVNPLTQRVVLTGSTQGNISFGAAAPTLKSAGGFDIFVASFYP
jgi:hypothetical protein